MYLAYEQALQNCLKFLNLFSQSGGIPMASDSRLSLGIDIGSTTAKVVLMEGNAWMGMQIVMKQTLRQDCA